MTMEASLARADLDQRDFDRTLKLAQVTDELRLLVQSPANRRRLLPHYLKMKFVVSFAFPLSSALNLSLTCTANRTNILESKNQSIAFDAIILCTHVPSFYRKHSK